MTRRSEGLTLESLWEAPAATTSTVDRRGGLLPPSLADRFPGELTVELAADRPTVVANFVSTLDGVVALGSSENNAGGGEISGFSDADRFMMALLRALADVVVVGAGTVRVGRRHVWTAGARPARPGRSIRGLALRAGAHPPPDDDRGDGKRQPRCHSRRSQCP